MATVNTLVVGGGGGGGALVANGTGGGGAGGYQANSSFTVTAQAYTITVGDGGAVAANSSSVGSNGTDSVFGSITATGGGGAASPLSGVAGNGGSGGGGGTLTTAGGTGSQGSNGGTGNAGAGGGGGGASAAGGNASGTTGGNGGAGTANSISGSSVTYAGGGGAGGNGADGTGGAGGGGNVNVAGTANTGGGGGAGKAGGSGIVIIAYKTDGSDGVSTSSTGGTITTSGANTIHTFTTSGTFTCVLYVTGVIAFDTVTTGTESSTSSKTLAHTCNGSNRLLVVGGWVRGNGNNPTGITYNGVAMTQVGTNLVVSTLYYDKIFLYYLIAPATGSNNVVATFGSANYNFLYALSYTEVSQSSFPDASIENGPTAGTSMTTSLTTVADNCWTVLQGLSVNGALSAGTGSTLRNNNVSNSAIFDSNGAQTPAGSKSMAFTTTINENKVGQMISFAPVASATTNGNFLAFM